MCKRGTKFESVQSVFLIATVDEKSIRNSFHDSLGGTANIVIGQLKRSDAFSASFKVPSLMGFVE